jgi:F0F1-type ATP synthase membrane subunit c/vacuolar-type H+-ATPase subunit K
MLGALILVLFSAALASAQITAPTDPIATANAVQIAKAGNSAIASNAAIGMGLSIVGIGIGLGLAGFGALTGMARQPEMKGDLTNTMLIAGGLVEGAGIISLILCFVTVLMLK